MSIKTVENFLFFLEDGGYNKECMACNKSIFSRWEKISFDINRKFENLGKIQELSPYIRKNGYNEYHTNGTYLESIDAPITLAYYPYHASEVLKCKNCSALFHSYIETGGMVPFRQLRWIRKELIDLTGL